MQTRSKIQASFITHGTLNLYEILIIYKTPSFQFQSNIKHLHIKLQRVNSDSRRKQAQIIHFQTFNCMLWRNIYVQTGAGHYDDAELHTGNGNSNEKRGF